VPLRERGLVEDAIACREARGREIRSSVECRAAVTVTSVVLASVVLTSVVLTSVECYANGASIGCVDGDMLIEDRYSVQWLGAKGESSMP